MKKIFAVLSGVLIFGIVSFGQSKSSGNAKLEKHIIDLDRSGWEAWKNKDTAWFQRNTTEEYISITSDGISDKAQVIQSTLTDCDVKSFSLDNFKFVMLDKKAVLLTYIATQDGECNGIKLSPKVQASVNYVKRNGKWLEAFYMETEIK